MQAAQKLGSEAHSQVRRNGEVEAQRRRWTFYETIKCDLSISGTGAIYCQSTGHMVAEIPDFFFIVWNKLNKGLNIPCKRSRSPDLIGLKSVPDIVAGFHRW